MRDVIFRAKRVDNGEWVEGYYVWVCNHFIFVVSDTTIAASGIDVHSDISIDIVNIDPETIGQFTGLTDRNGVKIFEGDILKQKTTGKFKKCNPFEWESYGIVRFGTYDFRRGNGGYCTVCFYLEHLKSISIVPSNYAVGSIQCGLNQGDIMNEYHPFEVIGNIYDNPELLQE